MTDTPKDETMACSDCNTNAHTFLTCPERYPKPTNSIRYILEPLARGWRGWTIDQLDGTSFIKCEMDAIEKTIAEAETALNAYILGEVMELIAEDVVVEQFMGLNGLEDYEYQVGQKDLQAELRNKANDRWGK